ncbi:MAG TPA: FAD-dependent monooxygenase [Pseudonocardia sp.]|uniref:FAD-dependent oxidoreductase n=1 Tax=Pseudonocardia sp. TaxID=60912 RepID=UPI002F41069C
MDADVLVVGAGPVGLLLAAELALAGVRPLVVERLAEHRDQGPGHRRTGAEALRRRGLGEALAAHHERGLADLRRDHGTERAHFAHLHKLDLVPPGEPTRERALIRQPELERLLAEHTAVLGVTVLRGASLTAITVRDDSVLATVGGRTLTASYLVGCDGGRSTVRGLAGFEFPGTDPYLVVLAGEVAAALPTAGRLPTGDLMHHLPRTGSGSYAGLLGVQELASASPPPAERCR